jgi:hypothetical protein
MDEKMDTSKKRPNDTSMDDSGNKKFNSSGRENFGEVAL